jgi:endonuclease III
MSIIHDALKKAQQGLSSSKAEDKTTPAPETPQKKPVPLFEDPAPAPVENLEPPEIIITNQKQAVANKIKSFLAIICALAITVASLWYLYRQFQNYIPQAQRYAKNTFDQLIHKVKIPEFKTKKLEDLKPLAQIIVKPISSLATPANPIATVKPPVPVPAPLPVPAHAPAILNIHGIMANATGNLVLIDNEVYQEGDEVDGAKIIKINLKSVTVNIDGKEEKIPVK